MSKLKIYLLVIGIISLISFKYVLSSLPSYTPFTLSQIKYDSNYFNLVDPQVYLKSADKSEEISNLILEVKTKKNFDFFIYFIPEMSIEYGGKGYKNIELFLNDLSYLILKGKEDQEKNSIFILYSIQDRQSRIRTGALAREYLSNKKMLEYQDKVKSYLRSEDYDTALLELIKKIHNRAFTENQFLSDIFDWFVDLIKEILIYLGVAIVFLFFLAVYGKTRDHTAENKLKRIKELTEKNKPRREIIETTCVICLEDLQPPQKDDLKAEIIEEFKEDNNKHSAAGAVPLIEDNNTIKVNVSNGSKEILNKENEKENFIAKLECGHSFHSKCISEWMTKQNKCPICREEIDKEEGSPSNNDKVNYGSTENTRSNNIARNLINIQFVLHPELTRMNFNYNENSVSWHYKSSTGNSSGSTYTSSWGFGSGGASSSW